MHLPSLFVLIVYVSGYLFLLFAAICLACGLYYLVELAEEYTSLTKRLIRVTVTVHLTLHLLLALYERFPLLPCTIGFLAHLVYLRLLRDFPAIRPASSIFLLAAALFLVDNVVWYRFFSRDLELFYNYRVAPAPAMAAFFLLLVWLVPCAFFCSLTLNDAVLPASAPITASSKRRTNVLVHSLDRLSTFFRSLLSRN